MIKPFAALIGAVLAFGAGSMAQASDALPTLNAEERSGLSAIGFVQTKGPERTVICSGILVAQDLVVTSAHCTTKYVGLMNTVEFIAGLNGTRFLANSGAVEIKRHPVWSYAAGFGKHRYDVALLRLARPISAELVEPITLRPVDAPRPEMGALVGYQMGEIKALHGRMDCKLAGTSRQGLLSSDCPATQGNSGGAVLTKGDDGWYLSGVIVAQARHKHSALLAEVDDWLREHVEEAVARDEVRTAHTQ